MSRLLTKKTAKCHFSEGTILVTGGFHHKGLVMHVSSAAAVITIFESPVYARDCNDSTSLKRKFRRNFRHWLTTWVPPVTKISSNWRYFCVNAETYLHWKTTAPSPDRNRDCCICSSRAMTVSGDDGVSASSGQSRNRNWRTVWLPWMGSHLLYTPMFISMHLDVWYTCEMPWLRVHTHKPPSLWHSLSHCMTSQWCNHSVHTVQPYRPLHDNWAPVITACFSQFINRHWWKSKYHYWTLKKNASTVIHGRRNKRIPSKAMETPFTAEEIGKAVKSMKNGKSTGPDNINAEFIKYAPISTHHMIAEIYNQTVECGDPPKEMTLGILSPSPNQARKEVHQRTCDLSYFYPSSARF